MLCRTYILKPSAMLIGDCLHVCYQPGGMVSYRKRYAECSKAIAQRTCRQKCKYVCGVYPPTAMAEELDDEIVAMYPKPVHILVPHPSRPEQVV